MLKITPDRTVENKRGHEFMHALHDLYIPLHKRINVQNRKINASEKIWFIIRMTSQEVTFHLGTSTEAETLVKQRLARYWPKAAVETSQLPAFPLQDFTAAELRYRRHNIFSLAADWREDTIPIAGWLNSLRDMKETDEARIVICMEPYSRNAWSDWSEKAYEQFKRGKTPQRRSLSSRITLLAAARMIDGAMEQVSEVMDTLLDGRNEAKMKDRGRRKKTKEDLEKREIMQDGKLDRSTQQKRNEPVFKTRIFLLSHSQQPQRRQITLRSLSYAFSELAGDNDLKRVEYGKRSRHILEAIEKQKVPFDIDTNLMSASEVGKMIQLPTASLQDEYKDYLKTIEHRQTALPDILLREGIHIGSIDFKGSRSRVQLPINDQDELCLPRIAIGGMGSGKTRGYGGNFGAYALKHGYSVFAFDVAKDELNDEIEVGALKLGVAKNKIIRLRFGKKAYRLDWCEAYKSGGNAANRLAAEALNFFNLHGREAGVETSRYIRIAGKTIGHTGGTLADMVRLFTDDKYRKEITTSLKDERLKTEWAAYEKLSEGMKGKVTDPVLNRIDLLTGDDYLRECMEATESLDFTKWMTGGYHVGIHIPQKDLGREAVDVLVDFLTAKIELAMFARPEKDQVPAFGIWDEPHQFLSASERWKRMAVESRKWRFGLLWLFHSWEQIPRDLAAIIKAAGPHYTLYPSSKDTYRALAEEMQPFSIQEAMKVPRWSAINIIRAGGITVESFIAQMASPPTKWK